MLGLVDYGSSDEEGPKAPQNNKTKTAADPEPPKPTLEQPAVTDAPSAPDPTSAAPAEEALAAPAEAEPAPGPSLPPSADELPADGPAPGPAAPPIAEPDEANSALPQSPYSAARAVLRDLTMPRMPNFDIPPSPPGSPPPKTTAQFANFLEIKKRGQHFNARLENSSALRNPSLLQKLRGFAGIGDADQYATTLPEDLALPASFPPWAYADQLNKTQQEVLRKREEELRKTQREAVEFVPASSSAGSSGLGIGDGKSTSMAERVRAGLSRESSGSPQVSDGGKRREGERRDRDYDDRRKRSRFKSRSRSPRRR